MILDMKLSRKELKSQAVQDPIKIIEKIISYLDEDSDNLNEASNLLGRQKTLNQKNNTGTISTDEYFQESNKIRIALLNLIDEIDFYSLTQNKLREWWDDLPHEWEGVFESNGIISPNEKKLRFLFEKQEALNIQSDYIEDLTPLSNMKGLKFLNILSRSIKSLDGIQTLTNLQTLKISECPRIKGISPVGEVKNLKKLELNRVSISDLTAINSLKELNTLILSFCPISDLTPIQNLNKITHINFYAIDVHDLSAIRHLDFLEELRIGDTPINSLKPIMHLRNLKKLEIEKTQINSIDGIECLTNLQELKIGDFAITTLEPFYQLENLLNFRFQYDINYISVGDINKLQRHKPHCSLAYYHD